VLIAPFQNRRYEPHYRKVLDLVRSGALGEVLQIRMCWHRFTRRWDWQAMKQFGGGALFNNGTHLLDQAMEFFDEASEPEITLDLRRGLSVGDAEEHMKLLLRAPGAPTLDLEYTNACAYEQDRWHIMGTGGGLTGTPTHLEWKTVDWSSMPHRELSEGPAAGRRYPEEEIRWAHHSWDAPAAGPNPYEMFYLELRDAVRSGAPMLVTPESVRRYVRVLDRCRAAFEAVS
jgi:scyllo-inositol 2-dehydrogenase (NADP+)